MRHTDEYADLISIGFSLVLSPTEQDMAEISVLNDALEAAGFSMEVRQSDGFPPMLLIACAVDKAERALNRGAGRKRKPAFDASVREVRAMMRLLGADETAAHFGVSRSTLFRRLKQDEDALF